MIYSEDLSREQKKKIIDSLNTVQHECGDDIPKIWGEVIEDRGSQITFSALGQQAPLAEKKKWDPDFTKRQQMKAKLDTMIPEFSVRLGGTTSIDVTKPGIDKAYGILKLRDILSIPIAEMIYIGDAPSQEGMIILPSRWARSLFKSAIQKNRNTLSKSSSPA